MKFLKFVYPLLFALGTTSLVNAELSDNVLEDLIKMRRMQQRESSEHGHRHLANEATLREAADKLTTALDDMLSLLIDAVVADNDSPSPQAAKGKKNSLKTPKGKKKGNTGPATIPDTASPSPPPVDPKDFTSSPTSENSIPIRLTPYSITYEGTGPSVPTADDLLFLEVATRSRVEKFMVEEFVQTSLTDLDDAITTTIRFVMEDPLRVEFQTNILMNPRSIFLPTVREGDNLLESAFTGDSAQAYIDEYVQGLPSNNPFRDTTSVLFTQPPPV